jgi:hypothetical protein
MKPEIFAEFLKRQGYHIIQTESCYWYNAQPGFYFYFPYHRLITPSEQELKKILWGEHCIGMRFFSPMESAGKSSYLIVCSDRNYDLRSVDGKSRSQTRKGLENFEIKQFGINELAHLGNALNYDTLTRQKRDPQILSEKKWLQYCSAAEGLDGFEAWGAFSDGKLASYLFGFQMEDHFTILYQGSATEYLRLCPNNALVFTVTRQKLLIPEVSAVSYGPESLDAPESLDTFKFNMGYSKRPIRQRIVFNPLIQPFIGQPLHKLVQGAARMRKESDTIRKIEGIIRFYREN